MGQDWLQLAVENNADWCGAIARSHGLPYRRTTSMWYCAEEMPPLYPNLVTLDAMPDPPMEAELLEATLRPGWGIKDSFSSLELNRHGFTVLKNAEWYVREPAAWVPPTGALEAVRLVETQRQFSAWVAAWGETPPGSTIFDAKVLKDESVDLLYVQRDGKVVAGIACNIGDAVVGISNAFGEHSAMTACIGRCVDENPSRALVGYGSSREIRGLQRLEFRSLGSLRIWLKD